MLFVCHLYVTPVYCNKTTEVGIMRFSLKSSEMSRRLNVKFDDEIRRGSLEFPRILDLAVTTRWVQVCLSSKWPISLELPVASPSNLAIFHER